MNGKKRGFLLMWKKNVNVSFEGQLWQRQSDIMWKDTLERVTTVTRLTTHREAHCGLRKPVSYKQPKADNSPFSQGQWKILKKQSKPPWELQSFWWGRKKRKKAFSDRKVFKEAMMIRLQTLYLKMQRMEAMSSPHFSMSNWRQVPWCLTTWLSSFVKDAADMVKMW